MMLFDDFEPDYLPDDGQNDVTDGSVENYPLDWALPDAPCPLCPLPDAGAGPADAD